MRWMLVVVALGACGSKSEKTEPPAKPPSAPRSLGPTSVDPNKFSLTCSAASDCTVVSTFPCDKCGCPQAAIAAVDKPRYATEVNAIDCSAFPKDERQCGECKPATADCVNGKCVAKP